MIKMPYQIWIRNSYSLLRIDHLKAMTPLHLHGRLSMQLIYQTFYKYAAMRPILFSNAILFLTPAINATNRQNSNKSISSPDTMFYDTPAQLNATK